MDYLKFDGVEYRRLPRYCNKPVCKCHDGNPHGPYWYANNTKYIGKELPADLLQKVENLKVNIPTINKAIADLTEEIKKHQTIVNRLDRTRRSLQALLTCDHLDQEDKKAIISLGLNLVQPIL